MRGAPTVTLLAAVDVERRRGVVRSRLCVRRPVRTGAVQRAPSDACGIDTGQDTVVATEDRALCACSGRRSRPGPGTSSCARRGPRRRGRSRLGEAAPAGWHAGWPAGPWGCTAGTSRPRQGNAVRATSVLQPMALDGDGGPVARMPVRRLLGDRRQFGAPGPHHGLKKDRQVDLYHGRLHSKTMCNAGCRPVYVLARAAHRLANEGGGAAGSTDLDLEPERIFRFLRRPLPNRAFAIAAHAKQPAWASTRGCRLRSQARQHFHFNIVFSRRSSGPACRNAVSQKAQRRAAQAAFSLRKVKRRQS